MTQFYENCKKIFQIRLYLSPKFQMGIWKPTSVPLQNLKKEKEQIRH